MAAIIPLHQTSKWAKRENLPPTRQRNKASRTREYLTPDEVERMTVAARHAGGRLVDRDALLIMMAYRPRVPRIGANRAAMGPDRPKGGHASRRQTQAWLAFHPSATRPGASGFARVEA